MAAQQLAGKGFKDIYNLSGGIKAWSGHEAFGGENLGLDIFTNLNSPQDVLLTAYSLEDGLKDFYMSMVKKLENIEAIEIFKKLAKIEDLHKDRLFDEYVKITGNTDKDNFEQNFLKSAIEGGMTTEEYINNFNTNVNDPIEVISLAMSIEAQALDLYSRASHRAETKESQKMLTQIANEEKQHLEKLGFLLNTLVEKNHG